MAKPPGKQRRFNVEPCNAWTDWLLHEQHPVEVVPAVVEPTRQAIERLPALA